MPCNQKQCECLQCIQKCKLNDSGCVASCVTNCGGGANMPVMDGSCMTCFGQNKNNLTKCGCNPPPPTISLLHILLITIIIVVVIGVTTGLVVHFMLQKKKSKK